MQTFRTCLLLTAGLLLLGPQSNLLADVAPHYWGSHEEETRFTSVAGELYRLSAEEFNRVKGIEKQGNVIVMIPKKTWADMLEQNAGKKASDASGRNINRSLFAGVALTAAAVSVLLIGKWKGPGPKITAAILLFGMAGTSGWVAIAEAYNAPPPNNRVSEREEEFTRNRKQWASSDQKNIEFIITDRIHKVTILMP